VNENLLPDHLIDDTIRLEVDLSVVRYTDSFHLGRNVTPLGNFSEPRTERFKLIQNIIRYLDDGRLAIDNIVCEK